MIPLVLALLAGAPAADATAWSVEAGASTVRYRIVHKLHRVEGRSARLEGKAVLEPDGRVLAMVRAPVGSFDSGDGNRDAHMQEALETGRFPFVVFKGIGRLPPGVLQASAGAAPVAVTLEGELDLHGVKRPLAVPISIALRPGGARVTGSFQVSLDAHRIERPSLLFVKIDDACTIDLDLSLAEARP